MASASSRLKVAVKKGIERSGIAVTKRSNYEQLRAAASRDRLYPLAMTQIEAVWRNQLMPGLPERDKRVELMGNLTGTQPAEAMHIINWLHEVRSIDGAICEMGCASGDTSALIANEIADDGRPFWIFDSFEGLSRPTAEDTLIDDIFDMGSMEAYEGTFAHPEDRVRARLRDVDFPDERVNIVAGFVPASLDRPGLPDKVAFAYVDFDLYEPIKHGLEWLHTRIAPGGVIAVDDYGWFSAGAQQAVDEFIAGHADDYEVRKVETWVGHFIGLARH